MQVQRTCQHLCGQYRLEFKLFKYIYNSKKLCAQQAKPTRAFATASTTPMVPTVRNACRCTTTLLGDELRRKMCTNANVSISITCFPPFKSKADKPRRLNSKHKDVCDYIIATRTNTLRTRSLASDVFPFIDEDAILRVPFRIGTILTFASYATIDCTI